MKNPSQGSRTDIPTIRELQKILSQFQSQEIRNGVNWRNKTIYSVLFCHWFLWQQKLKLVTKLNCDIEFKSHLIKWQKSDMDIRKITRILSHKWEISSQIWELWTYDNPATTIPQPITIRQHTFHGSKAIYSTIHHPWVTSFYHSTFHFH